MVQEMKEKKTSCKFHLEERRKEGRQRGGDEEELKRR